MSDAEINHDDPQGQRPRGEEWAGDAGVPDPALASGGFDALEGTGEPESSWLLEDDGFDLAASSEPAGTESVQALPTELDAFQEQPPAPTWSEQEATFGDDPMIGASYVEPEAATAAAMRALVPAGLCMALSFGAIAVWSFVKEGAQDVPDVVTADLEIEGPARPYSEPDVELVTPVTENLMELGRRGDRRDGAVAPADAYGASVVRSTVDSPREPGELPPAAAATEDASAASARGRQATEHAAAAAEVAAAPDLTDVTSDQIAPVTGSSTETDEAVVAVDVTSPSTPERAAHAFDAEGDGDSEAAEVTPADLAAEGAPAPDEAPAGEDVAGDGDAPGTGELPDSYILDVEPLDEETLRLLDPLEAAGADLAEAEAGSAVGQDPVTADPAPARTVEVVSVERTTAPGAAPVAPLPGDEALGAFALRFPGPDFGPAWPDVPASAAIDQEAGPSASFLPFGFFGEDLAASVDVDPEFVEAEFEITGPAPVGPAETGAAEPGELDDAELGAAHEGPPG
ncbi:MAG: hypothetical protein VX460_03900, partial [Planctomycetota bacterium]|nr:hypothetical protein [Planctomycetota bacterium]